MALEVYLNADDIEIKIKRTGYINLEKYFLRLTNDHWIEYLQKQPSILSKIPEDIASKIKINQNIIVVTQTKELSYTSAVICDFLREMLFLTKQSFTFETVMSHSSKVEFISRLKDQGYRTYLYYVATESPEINIARISTRVIKGGHPVNPEKVTERYKKSLFLLYDAIKVSDRAYIFDNSGTETVYIAEITSGKQIKMIEDSSPNWFQEFVLSKSY